MAVCIDWPLESLDVLRAAKALLNAKRMMMRTEKRRGFNLSFSLSRLTADKTQRIAGSFRQRNRKAISPRFSSYSGVITESDRHKKFGVKLSALQVSETFHSLGRCWW